MQIRHDLFTAIGTLGLGIFIMVHAAGMPWVSAGIPGPAVFPWMISIGMIILSIVNVITSLIGKSLPPSPLKWEESSKALWVIVISGVYLLTLKRIDFIIVTPVYASLLTACLSNWKTIKENKKVGRAIAQLVLVSMTLTTVVYLVFSKVFLVSFK